MPPDNGDFANPDQALLHGFLGGGAIAVDTNPLARALGSRLLRVDRAAGIVELQFEPDALFIQGTGVLQGGALTAMLDFAMAFAVLARLPRGDGGSTVALQTSFMKPAPAGVYRALGEVAQCGRTLAFASARLWREGEPAAVAAAASTLAVRRR